MPSQPSGRVLQVGETVLGGDSYLSSSGWALVSDSFIGQKVRDNGAVFITNRKPQPKPFDGWIAFLNDDYEDEDERIISWYVGPKTIWEEEQRIPDDCIGKKVPGFVEVQEHRLECREGKDLEEQREMLKALGFEII